MNSAEKLKQKFPDSELFRGENYQEKNLVVFFKLINLIKKNCKTYLNYLPTSKVILCRGSRKIKTFFAIKKPRKDRKPLNTDKRVNDLVDNFRQVYFPQIPSRKESIFAEPIFKSKEEFSNFYGYLYLVFPADSGLAIFQNPELSGKDFFATEVEAKAHTLFVERPSTTLAIKTVTENKNRFSKELFDLLNHCIIIMTKVFDQQLIPDNAQSEILIELFEHTNELATFYKSNFLTHKNGVAVANLKNVVKRISDLLDLMDELKEYYRHSNHKFENMVYGNEVVIKTKVVYLINRVLQPETLYALFEL